MSDVATAQQRIVLRDRLMAELRRAGRRGARVEDLAKATGKDAALVKSVLLELSTSGRVASGKDEISRWFAADVAKQ